VEKRPDWRPIAARKKPLRSVKTLASARVSRSGSFVCQCGKRHGNGSQVAGQFQHLHKPRDFLLLLDGARRRASKPNCVFNACDWTSGIASNHRNHLYRWIRCGTFIEFKDRAP
jgi:hypothetical protein